MFNLPPENEPVVDVTFFQSPPHPDDPLLVYWSLVHSLLRLCSVAKCVLTFAVATALSDIEYSKIPHLLGDSSLEPITIDRVRFQDNVSRQYSASRVCFHSTAT
jgi:hypothetical protein